MEESNYVFTRVSLFILAILIAIIGAVFIFRMWNGADTVFQYINNYLGSSNNNSYTSENLETFVNIKLYFYISIIYVVFLWASLTLLPIMLSVILDEGEIVAIEIILRVLGFIFIVFGTATFIFYCTRDDFFKNIEWARNIRLSIGSIFLVFNLFQGFICIAIANIHHRYCNIGGGNLVLDEFIIKESATR